MKKLSVIVLSLVGMLLLTECSTIPSGKKFILADQNMALPIYVDQNADSLILWAVNDLAEDIETITGQRPAIVSTAGSQKDKGVYIGQINSPLIQSLNYAKTDSLKGQWEKFHIQRLEGNLIIAGSDVRGTVYGIFELAERMGISPWKWWADVTPLKQDVLTLEIPNKGITQEPSVQYRGIFLNDEDWGLQPWAAKTFEPEVNDVGPKTYEKIFQLLLRLKANTIWPAMHPSTQAFFSIPGNKEMAEKYHIMIGTSHAEPMLRNNVDEWDKEAYGPYNYFSNSEKVKEYWQERLDEANVNNSLFTMGMRGIHDSGMEGSSTLEEKVEMLESIITDQRNMLSQTYKQPIPTIPQVFIPYKEVLYLYNNGLNVPEDITLMWTDDNYGYIRRLSDSTEQQRAGGSGVYYHLSYWGRPHDYLWLSTTQPGLIWYEMTRAYQNGTQKIWIANVGDIKPAEYNMEFFLDLAWDVHSINETTITDHLRDWSAREFGDKNSEEIATIMDEYYRLAFLRKPEFMGWSQTEPTTQTQLTEFSTGSQNDLQRRLDAYADLYSRAEQIRESITEERQDAYFQLVEYPVKCAALMNHKFLYRQIATESKDSIARSKYEQMTQDSYDEIKALTNVYNNDLNNGKWKHMMSMSPRNLPAYQFPITLDIDSPKELNTVDKQRIFIQAKEYTIAKGGDGYSWKRIDGLGYSHNAVTLFPFSDQLFSDDERPYVEYSMEVDKPGAFELQIRCLPTHSNEFTHQVAVQIDNKEPQAFDINTQGRSEQWKENVLRNAQILKYQSSFETAGTHTIRLYVNQTGIVLDQLMINFNLGESLYEIPVE